MNWEAIKLIYIDILKGNYKMEYLGGDKYKICNYYPSGERRWEENYKNERLHGKLIYWQEDGIVTREIEYENGKAII